MDAVQIRPSLFISRVYSATRFGLDRRCSSTHFVMIPALAARKKLSVSLCLSESSTRTPGFGGNTSLNYTNDHTKAFIDETIKSQTTAESSNGKVEMNVPLHEEEDFKPKRYAKLHDFCLGIPFALAATLLWKHLQVYSLTKKIFPSGFYVAVSAAMLCFYSYVLISGGNPPPKKKSAAVSPS